MLLDGSGLASVVHRGLIEVLGPQDVDPKVLTGGHVGGLREGLDQAGRVAAQPRVVATATLEIPGAANVGILGETEAPPPVTDKRH